MISRGVSVFWTITEMQLPLSVLRKSKFFYTLYVLCFVILMFWFRCSHLMYLRAQQMKVCVALGLRNIANVNGKSFSKAKCYLGEYVLGESVRTENVEGEYQLWENLHIYQSNFLYSDVVKTRTNIVQVER